MPKGNKQQPRRPIAHRLYSRVLELEAELEGMQASLATVPALKTALSHHPKTTQDKLVEQLTKVVAKVLRVVQKYKESQLDFYDQVRVLDPRQRDMMPKEISKYPALFSRDTRDTLETTGQWALYWKQRTPPKVDGFKVLDWWDNVAMFQNLAPLAMEATICLTQPITTSIAEGSFRALKGLLSSERLNMSEDIVRGYLFAMINGDICGRIPQWALQ